MYVFSFTYWQQRRSFHVWLYRAKRKCRCIHQSASRRYISFREHHLQCNCRKYHKHFHPDGQRNHFYADKIWTIWEVLKNVHIQISEFGLTRLGKTLSMPCNLRNSIRSPQSTLKGWSHLFILRFKGSNTKPSGHNFSLAWPSSHS